MDNTYDYSALWDEIAEDVESGLTDRLNKIDFEGIIKKALSRYHLKMEDIDWDSKAFQLALSKGLYEAINGVKKQVKADLGDFDIANYMKISPDALNAKIKTTFKNMTETLKEYGKEAAQEFTDEFFQAMTVARVRKIKLPDKVKEKWEDAYNDLMDELRIGLGGKDTGEYKIGSDLDAKYTKASQTYQEWYIAIQDRIEEYKSTVEMAKKIVNTIRQTLPKNASEDQVRDVVNGLLESSGSGIAKTQQSLKELDKTVKELGDEVADQHISDAYKELFEEIKKVGSVAGLDVTNEKLRKSLEELKLIGKEAENLTLVNQGYTNEGGIIGEDKVVLLRKNTEENLQNSQELMGKLEEAYKRGVNVARIIDVINDGSKVFMEVQEKMSGKTLGNHVDVINWDFLDATEEQINRFAEDIKKLQDLSVGVDINLSNIFYDKDKGFGFIDLDLQPAMYEGLEDFLQDARGGIVGEIEDECAEMNKDLEKIPLAENFFNKFAEGFKGSLNVHSPSKETAKIADNVVDGFVEEIEERLPEVEKAGEKLGDAVKDGIKNSLQGAAIDEDDIDAILGKKDIAGQLGYAIKEDNELPEWAEQEAERAIENLEEMHQGAEKTEKAISRVMEIWQEFGTPSDALDAGRFERVQEALDYLGGKFAEMNTEADDFSEHKLNAEFYRELIKELDLTEDQLTVVKGLIEDIYTLAPGGRFEHLYTPVNASKFIFGELDKIKGILNGEYQITDKDLKDAKIVLESIQASVEETTQAEVQMGEQGEAATEQIKEGLKEVQEEAEKTVESLQQVGDKLSIVGYHGTAKKWKGDAFDVNQTRAAQLGSGMYFVDSPEKLEGFLSRPGSGDIKKTELNLERCFMLTKDYISSIEDINKILGTTFDETTKSKEVINAIRNFTKASKANSLSFRQSMLDLGYQGLYAGDNLANKKIDNELVVYDESLLQNLETINKADFQSLLNNVDDMTQAEVQMGEQGEVATDKIHEGLKEAEIAVDNLGHKIDEAFAKKLSGTALVNDLGEVIELFHATQSLEKFDKFDSERFNSGKYGKGAYFGTNSNIDTGWNQWAKNITTWYANVRRVFDVDKDVFNTEEINNIISKYLKDASSDAIEQIRTELSTPAKPWQGIKDIAKIYKELSPEQIWQDLGIDALSSGTIGNPDHEVMVFDPEKIFPSDWKAPLSELEALNEEIDRTKFTIEAFGQEEDEVIKQQVADLQKELALLEEKRDLLSQSEQTLVSAEEVNTQQQLTEQIEKANAALEEQKQQIAELEGQNKSLQSSLQAQGDELQHAYEEQGELQDQLYKEQGTSGYLEEELNKSRQISDELKEQIDIQQKKLDLAEKERAYYEEAANNGEREITNLENQLKQKQTQDETLNKQVSELDEKNKALTEVNQNLQKELQLEKEVNAQKTSSAAKVDKKEIDNVDKLTDALRKVIDAVNEKTEAFKKEQSVVKEVVKSEVGDVAALKGAVDDVSKARKTNQQNKQQQAKNTENEKIKEVLKYYEQLEKTEQRYQYLIAKRDISNKDLSVQEAMQLQKLQTQRDLEQERLLTLKEITKEVRAAQESYKHIAEMENQNASGATRNALVKSIENQISKTQAKIDSGKYTQLSSNAVQTRLNNVKNANFDEANVEQLQTYVQLLEEMNKQFVRAGNNTKLTKLLGEVNQVLADNSKLSRDLKAQFANLGTQLESALQTGSSQEEVQALTRRFLELKTEMIKTGQSGKSFFGMIKNDITQASARMIAQYMSFQDWIRYIRQAVSAVTDLNTALNQLKIISGSTDSALSHVAQDAYNLANELGMSTTEVVSSITEWRRLGKTIDESMILAEQAARLSTGGIMDINEATTALISSMQAFEMGADEASKIVDQYIYLGKQLPIDNYIG